MHIGDSPEEAEFRALARGWLSQHAAPRTTGQTMHFDDLAEHVDELALAAVFPAHEGFALAQRHDQIRVIVIVQRLVPLGAQLHAPGADVFVLEQHLGADRPERIASC